VVPVSTELVSGSVRRGGEHSLVREIKPIWTSASFLIYTGGLTVLAGGMAALGYLSGHYGKGALAGWSLLVLVILYGIAHAFRIAERRIAAGIFAFASVIAWAVFVGVLFTWWGWDGVNGSFSHWSWARLAFWLLILAAALDDRRRFGFPFIRFISLFVAWIFVIDLITNGGNFTAVVTLLVGLVYLVIGVALTEQPSSFWFHLMAGLLIGGPVLYWWHTSDAQWAIVSLIAFFYVGVAYATRRSSWAFLGTIGFFAATFHYLIGSPTDIAQTIANGEPPGINSPWSPALALGLLGFWLVLLGLAGRRTRPSAPAPVISAPAAAE
jgi:hypothetical protein